MTRTPQLLTPTTAAAYLRQRGLLDSGPVRVRALSGGVSSVVLAASDGKRAVVVKQALPRLRVADEWFASQSRTITEAEALELAGKLAPGVVPGVLHADAGRYVVVLDQAPDSWHDWRSLLLAGYADCEVAARLGRVLATWHRRTWGGVGLTARMDDTEPFEQLRVDPYYRTLARRRPELAGLVLRYADRMRGRRRCLVHGDLSPKNILVGPADATWVIDFEVAHRGDPAFDVAFLLSHLLLKSLHRPSDTDGFDDCIREFLHAYAQGIELQEAWDWPYLMGHVGCLLLARVHGKSPVTYLSKTGMCGAHRLGTGLLQSPPETLDELLRRRERAR